MGLENMSFIPEGVKDFVKSKIRKAEPPPAPLAMTETEDLRARGFNTTTQEDDVKILTREDDGDAIDVSSELLPEKVCEVISKVLDSRDTQLVKISPEGPEYEVRQVGVGGFEKTFLVSKDGTPKQVVKSIPFDVLAGPQGYEKRPWEDQLESMATALIHLPSEKENPDARHITNVTFIEYDQSKKMGFIGFEYANRGNLATVERRTESTKAHRDPAIVAAVAEDLARGLRVLHQAGVLHLDIKMPNIVLHQDDDGKFLVKLTDFGITSFSKEQKAEGIIVGTPFYVAPEKLQTGISGTKSDIYALGVVLAELLVGKNNINEITNDVNDASAIMVAAATGAIREHIIKKISAVKKERVFSPEEEALCDMIYNMVHVNPDVRPDVDKVIEVAHRLTQGNNSELLGNLFVTLRPKEVDLEDDGGPATQDLAGLLEDEDIEEEVASKDVVVDDEQPTREIKRPRIQPPSLGV